MSTKLRRVLVLTFILIICIILIVLSSKNVFAVWIASGIAVFDSIVALLQIEGARRFLVECFKDSLDYLGRLTDSIRQLFSFLGRKIRERIRLFLIGLAVLLLIVLASGSINWFVLHPDPFSTDGGNDIGLSLGRTYFDADRGDASIKQDAAQAYQNKNSQGAEAYWDLAMSEDEMDAEAAIYKENQLVLDSGRPYVMIIVLVSLSGHDQAAIFTGRDILQGAYVAQAEYNGDLPAHTNLPGHNDSSHQLPNRYLLRLIIANVGTPSSTDTQVAQRIVQAWNEDNTIVGVTGQFTNEDATVQELQAAKIPMLSSTQLTGTLVGIPYLFSVAPSPEQEGSVAADYACRITHGRVALFYDAADPSSNQLQQAFSNEFTSCGGSVSSYQYTRGQKGTLEQLFDEEWSADPDLKLIYLPDGSPYDARDLRCFIRKKGSQAQILGSNAFYQFVHDPEPGSHFAGLLYTAFAFHDQWNGKIPEEPWLFIDYPSIFNTQNQHQYSFYGVKIPNSDVILAYDAVGILARVTRENFLKTLKSTSFPGVSGCLTFDSNGQPVDKAIVVLQVQTNGTNQPVDEQGHYTKC